MRLNNIYSDFFNILGKTALPFVNDAAMAAMATKLATMRNNFV